MRIVLVGGGRLGATLAGALRRAHHDVTLVVRCGDRRAALANDPRWRGIPIVTNVADAPAADADYWTVPDRALSEVALRDAALAPIAWHAAGSLPSAALPARAGVARGVLHPLAACPDPLHVPGADPLDGAAFGIAGDATAAAAAHRIATDLGGRPLRLPEGAATAYHAAAALAANDLAALLLAAEQAGVTAGLDATTLRQGLVHLSRTALDALARVPEARPWVDGLTGAVARGDDATLRAHLAVLDGEARTLHASASRWLTEAAAEAGRLPPEAVERLRAAASRGQ